MTIGLDYSGNVHDLLSIYVEHSIWHINLILAECYAGGVSVCVREKHYSKEFTEGDNTIQHHAAMWLWRVDAFKMVLYKLCREE